MAELLPLLTLICVLSGKPCQIAGPFITLEINVWFQGRGIGLYVLNNFKSIKFKIADEKQNVLLQGRICSEKIN